MRVLLMLLALVAMAAIPAAAAVQQGKSSASPAPQGVKVTKPAPLLGSPVNLNTASQAQLETLPGVGPKAAQRVIEYRKDNGPFKKIEDLMNVKGFGEKTFLKLKPMLTTGDKAGSN